MNRAWTVAPIVVAGLLAACTSPEATRTRAHGRGADVGNVGSVVKMHEGADPYWRTPTVKGIGAPPLDPARQAAELSR